jgi:predicted Zn-dependent protease
MFPIMGALVVLALLLAGGGAWLLFAGPPALAQPIAAGLPPSVGIALGNKTVYDSPYTRRPCTRQAGQAAIATLLYRLTDGMDPAPEIEVTVSRHAGVNAHAAPGGRIILYRGLIERAESPDQVAAVLAHLLGHAVAQHPLAGLVRQLGPDGVLYYARGDTNAMREALAEITDQMPRLSFSVEEEDVANAWAHDRLSRAGIAPDGFRALLHAYREAPQAPMEMKWLIANHRQFGPPDPPPADARPALNDLQWRQLKSICG